MLALKTHRKPVISIERAQLRGFTLIEILIVVALIAILASIATPNLSGISANQALRNASSELMASIMNARSAAIKRGARVVIQPQSGSDWATGWLIYVDLNRNDIFDSATDELIDTSAALPANVTAPAANSTACTGTSSAPAALFRYDSAGFLAGGGGNGYVRLQAPTTGRERCLIVNLPGRPRTCEPGSSAAPC